MRHQHQLLSQPVPQLTRTQLPLHGNYFVTGTDTEIGKTTTTAQLIKQLAAQGQQVYAIKPVTAGLNQNAQGECYSEDAQRINQFSTLTPPMQAMAPICLTTPCSPHIAAQIDGVSLTTAQVVQAVKNTLTQYPADTVLIEGAGGWFTPINANETLAEVASALQCPVIVVVGIKLGSLNHALLTLKAIWQAGLPVAVVVFNNLAADTPFFAEQVEWLSRTINSTAQHFQSTPPLLLQQDFVNQ